MNIIWRFDTKHQTWETEIQAKDHLGEGGYQISIIPRPFYWDRGKWLVQLRSKIVYGVDDCDLFPRYYFKLENAKEEMLLWANARQDIRDGNW